MNRSGAYRDARREFVTSPEKPSIKRELAAKYGRTPSSMYRIARLEGWEAEREAYHQRTETLVSRAASDELARRLIALNDDFLSAAEETIETYRAKVKSGDITPTPADVTKIVMTVRDLLAHKDESGAEVPGAGLHISEAGLRALAGTVEGLARSRLAPAGVGTPAEPKLVGSSEG